MFKSTTLKKNWGKRHAARHIAFVYTRRLRLYFFGYCFAIINLGLIMISENILTSVILFIFFIIGILIIIISYRLCRQFQIKYFNGEWVWTRSWAYYKALDYIFKDK
jgi:hypothetical protein